MGTILGMMVEPTRGIGWTIICMAKESINGLMVESTRVNTSTIKSMASAPIHTPMAGLTVDNGHLGSNTEKEFSSPLRELGGKEYGKKARELIGLMNQTTIKIPTCSDF